MIQMPGEKMEAEAAGFLRPLRYIEIKTNRVPPLYMVDRNSAAYMRVTAAGFTIGSIQCEIGFIVCPFTCVCGRKEFLRIVCPDADLIDIALILEDMGAISVEHLRADGYSEDEILKIRVPYSGVAA